MKKVIVSLNISLNVMVKVDYCMFCHEVVVVVKEAYE